MIISVCKNIISDNEIEQDKTKMYQLGGGGGSIEERCGFDQLSRIFSLTHTHF